MNEKKYVSAGNFTTEIIICHILYGILVTIAIAIIEGILGNALSETSTWVKNTISMVLSTIGTIVVWKLAVKAALKKKTIDRAQINSVVRNLFVFFIAIILIMNIWNVIKFENELSAKIESATSRPESSIFYISDAVAEETVAQIRTQQYVPFAIGVIVELVANIAMIRYAKYKLEAEL